MKTHFIRKGRDGKGKVIGVVGRNPKGNNVTYRPKLDNSYSVGKQGRTKHYRPSDNKYGYTINNNPPINTK